MNIDIDQIERLMRVLREHDFHEIDLRHGEERITLRRGPGVATGATWPGGAAFPMSTGDRERAIGLDEGSTAPPAPSDDPALVTVTSPLVGTFYRAASPEARVFVEVGSLVRKGTVLCIIEAFKLMNEIECEVDGVVTELLVENSKPVEFGQGLLRIRRSG